MFDRDSEVYVQLLRRIRRDVLVEAAQHNVSLVMTGVYTGTPELAEALRTVLEPVRSAGGSAAFVQLVAREELFQRVQNGNRRVFDKLVDAARFLRSCWSSSI